ncbi:hypothetical protein [Leisingera aquaemixtae]|uniref:Uncharacterized protein n=1 Tax=Leisingera aquaemixtae TaxID=1396826 RepID=A0A0P1H9J0_9RHOB|nr:hypothetical protein [Leisingera aquaemixtae]CUH99920.1 hypothetical protein PHA8399_02046 [Leisingera aquaemixtae]
MDLAFLDLEVSDDIWIPMLAAIIGGVLAMLGSLLATWVQNQSARKARSEDREFAGAESAYAVFHKLLDGHNSAANLERQINEMFDIANRKGHADMEPWAKVRALVGAPYDLENVAPKETAFLIRAQKADLLNEVHLIQRRLATTLVAADQYNELRKEMDTFLLENLSEGKLGEGTQLSAAFETDKKTRIEMREAQLNSLLGQIMENLKEDIPRAWDIIQEFRAAASEQYGEKFPPFKIERVL